MKRKSLFLYALFAGFLCVVGIAAPKAFALTITPVRYEVTGDPGQVLSEQMTLVNESKKAQTYYASFANFEAQGDTGNPSFVDPKDDLGTWMTTEQASVNLAAGQQKLIHFTIHIPKDAEPGGHFAAIFWGTSPGSQPGQVSVGTKTGLLVLLSVTGDVKVAAGLVDFQIHNNKHFYRELPVGFQYHFSNQGGDRVKPNGFVIIRSILGWRVTKINANQFDGNVLPGTTRKFTPEWAKRDSVDERDQELALNEKYSFSQSVKDEWHNFAIGIFRANLNAQFGTPQQSIWSKSVYFLVLPWELLLSILVIAIPLFLLLRLLVRRYNRSVIKKAHRMMDKKQSL